MHLYCLENTFYNGEVASKQHPLAAIYIEIDTNKDEVASKQHPLSVICIEIDINASRVAQWLRALYCSASCATRDSGFAPRLCHNRPRPGGPWGDAQLA